MLLINMFYCNRIIWILHNHNGVNNKHWIFKFQFFGISFFILFFFSNLFLASNERLKFISLLINFDLRPVLLWTCHLLFYFILFTFCYYFTIEKTIYILNNLILIFWKNIKYWTYYKITYLDLWKFCLKI